MRTDELRAMVLDAALVSAVHVVNAVRDNGLTAGGSNEHVDIDGASWHLNIAYGTDRGFVQVTGHPASDHERPQVPHFLAELMQLGEQAQEDTQAIDRFQFAVPVRWLEAAHRSLIEGRP